MVETWDFKWHQLRKKENNIMMIFLLKIQINLKFEETWTREATVIMACNDTASSPAEASRRYFTSKAKSCQFSSFSPYLKNVMSDHSFNNAFHT